MELINIPIGDYLPDLPAYRNPGALLISNARPIAGGYAPFKDLTVLTDALTLYPRGAIATVDTDGNTRSYAADANSYYKLTTTAWTTANGTAPSAGSGENYEFAQFGNKVVAVHYSGDANEETQVATLGDAAFADLFTSTLKPRARHVTSYEARGFLILGNTYDAVDGSQPQRVWWPAQNDILDADPAANTQAGFQDLSSADGAVQRLIAHEFVTVFMERAIYRMVYEGPPTLFRFERLLTGRGTIAPGSVAEFNRLMFYLDADGIHMTNGIEDKPIGKNKIDRTLMDDIDTTNLDRVSALIDPETDLYMMAYPSGATGATPDRILVYHWPTERFALVDLATEYIFLDQTKGYTVETLDTITTDLDALVESLDSRFYIGGNYLASAFNTDRKLCSFTGSALTAVLETGEAQPFAPNRTIVNEVRPLVDGTAATTTIQVGTRNLHTAANTFAPAVSTDVFGSAKVGVDARYMRFRKNISGGFDTAQGFQIIARRGGQG